MSMPYKTAVRKMCEAQERRLVINLDDLRDYDREFCDGCALFSLPATSRPHRIDSRVVDEKIA